MLLLSRLSVFSISILQERYEGMKDDPDGVPPFHYGSHYSSAGAPLSARSAEQWIALPLLLRSEQSCQHQKRHMYNRAAEELQQHRAVEQRRGTSSANLLRQYGSNFKLVCFGREVALQQAGQTRVCTAPTALRGCDLETS